MDKLNWQRKFESGNRPIDMQHQQLFEKISNCIEASRHGSVSVSKLVDCLRDVQQCMVEHFRYEEMLMSRTSQKDSDHKEQHAYIARLLDEEIMKFSCKAEGRNSAQGILFSLYDWHIAHLDSENDYWRRNNSRPVSRQ